MPTTDQDEPKTTGIGNHTQKKNERMLVLTENNEDVTEKTASH